MHQVIVGTLPKVLATLQPRINVNFARQTKFTMNVITRGLCEYNGNQFMKNSYTFCNASLAINTSLPFLSGKQIHKQQRRHFSNDHLDGRAFYNWVAESTPVEYTKDFLVSVHDFTGLPWWGTIICTTIVLRSAVTLPLAVYQVKDVYMFILNFSFKISNIIFII